MGLMKTAAVKGIIPSGNKVNELRTNLLRLITEVPLVLEERFGKEGLEAVSEIFRRLGMEDARLMKDRLGFEDDLQDSVDSWRVIGHIMGSKMEIQTEGEDRAVATHSFCPQYAMFKEKGKLHYCEFACWPYVGKVAEGIAPGVTMEIVQKADNDNPCTKALVMTKP
ncbi:MAG: L-2-amino-thiazoline-4-carboxylic acid hydrolase [Candidatus Thorarchaeota archaeon]